jgi:SOS response regulatory protein OraA/RecX
VDGEPDDEVAGPERLGGSAADAAPVASFDGLADGGLADGGSSDEAGAAPVASFDVGEIGAARDGVPVADMGNTTTRRAGRRLWPVDAETGRAGRSGGGRPGRRSDREASPGYGAADLTGAGPKPPGRRNFVVAGSEDAAGPDHRERDQEEPRTVRRQRPHRDRLSPEHVASAEAAAREILECAERGRSSDEGDDQDVVGRPDRARGQERGPGDGRRRRSRRGPEPDATGSDGGDVDVDGPDVSRRSAGGRSPGGRSRDAPRAGQPGRRRGDAPAGDGEPEADPLAVARAICLRLLTDRARSRHELEQALRRRDVPEEAVRATVARLREVGLINDGEFAEQWVRSRHVHKGLGRHALVVELRRKGVADDVAGEALEELGADAEESRARQLVERKLRGMALDTPEQRAVAVRRLAGMLARKGYGSGIAFRVVRDAIAAHGAETDELGDHLED